jgi:hypothetical protein
MKKETVIAIVLGIIAGISIAAVVILNSRHTSGTDNELVLGNPSPTVTINTSETAPLLITSPDNETTTEESSIILKGSGPKGALLVIQTPLEEYTSTIRTTTFSQEIQLMAGENVIRVTSYAKKNIDSRTLSVYSIPAQ